VYQKPAKSLTETVITFLLVVIGVLNFDEFKSSSQA